MAGAGHLPQQRAAFTLRYADDETLELGPRTAVMGILNVTPDSFSDGGKHLHAGQALRAAAGMLEAGVDIVDVGGESTRPGAEPVNEAEELRRTIPVIEALKREFGARVCVDTTKAAVARAALDAGADMVNDVSALREPEMLPLLCRRKAPVVLMHMRGSPRSMQRDTRYDDLLGTILEFLGERVERAISAGMSSDRILVDPGIGFGKSAAGNLSILRQIPELAAVGQPILIGASRKSFIGSTQSQNYTKRR